MSAPTHFDLTNTPLRQGTTLIEASAGTGKTFTIAGLCVRLVVEHDVPIQQILVTTYTVPATAELRDRIRRKLRDALTAFEQNESDDEFLKKLLERNQDCRPEICRRLDFALRNFDEAPIFSIHGFCHRMLGDKAFESGVLFDAELVPDQKPLLHEIADDFWRKNFYEGDSILAAVALRDGLSPRTFADLLQKLTNHPTIATIPDPVDSFENVKASLAETFRELCDCWQREESVIRRFFEAGNNGWAKGNFSHAKPEKMAECFEQLRPCLIGTVLSGPPLDHLVKLTTGALAKSVRAGATAPSHRFFALCDEFLKWEKNFLLSLRLEFIRWSADEVAKRKINKNILSFDDLQMRLLKALNNPEGEALALGIRTRFKAALIDEFQDTDPVQYDIFRRVYANTPSWLFFIGDPKQAIYGFRGADVFTYMTAADEVKERFTLGTNWRSEAGLVRAVNHLFAQHENPFVFEKIAFHPVNASGKPPAECKSPGVSEPFQLWLCNEEEPLSQMEAWSKIAGATATEISRLLNGSATLDGRKLLPQDFAVLVANHRQAAIIQEALQSRLIPSVLHSRDSVFQSDEARDLLRLLQALAEPSYEDLLRAALVLDIFGLKGEEIERLRSDENAWEKWLLRFQGYHEQWRHGGFIQMFRLLLTKEKVRTRLLGYPDGERRLTNLLHLSELLHQAATESRLGINSLVKWFAEQITDGASGEGSELRLERDENAVRIVTMHKSKGLEYHVVFCPFTWEGSTLRTNEVPTFHDGGNENRLTQDLGSERLEEHKNQAVEEKLAEKLRLLYVAVTRAKNRCYLVWGRFAKSESSAPNYLFNAPVTAEDAGVSRQAFQSCAEKIAMGAEDVMAVTAIPEATAEPYQPERLENASLAERTFRGKIQRDWHISSFSSLTLNRSEELPDYDALNEREKPALTAKLSGIFAFPRGAQAGSCLHKIYEDADFQNASSFSGIVAKVLRDFGFSAKEHGECVTEALVKSVSTPLGAEGFTFAQIAKANRLSELEFHFPIANVTRDRLAGHFTKHHRPEMGAGWPEKMEKLDFSPTRGFLKGFIDLVFQHNGRFYIVDWKSNWLGAEAVDYHSKAIHAEMLKHCYFLQYHLYSVALHRYLSVRLSDYDYDQHFGGVFYVFVRGVEPKQPELGIFADRPNREMIVELSELLQG